MILAASVGPRAAQIPFQYQQVGAAAAVSYRSSGHHGRKVLGFKPSKKAWSGHAPQKSLLARLDQNNETSKGGSHG
jgi:hypothetical protein